MSIYYKYATDGSNLVVLSYVDDCVYWYTYEELGIWLLGTLGNIFHVNLLWYVNCFMYIRISKLKYYYISVNQDRYATSVVAKYLDNSRIKESSKFHKTTLYHDTIFTKEDASTSDKNVEVLYIEYNINYISCLG